MRRDYSTSILAGIFLFLIMTSIAVWAFILMGWFILLLTGLMGAFLGYNHQKQARQSQGRWMASGSRGKKTLRRDYETSSM